jgi:hypothetical protein
MDVGRTIYLNFVSGLLCLTAFISFSPFLNSLLTVNSSIYSRDQWFSGPTPSNAPRNDVAPLKTITYRARSLQYFMSGLIIANLSWIHGREISFQQQRCCRGPNVVVDDGQVDAPNSQLISCLDSSLGRASAWSPGGAEVRAPPVTCLSRRSPRG